MRTGADKAILQELFYAAVEAASPYSAVRNNLRFSASSKKLTIKKQISLDLRPYRRIFVIGAGKGVCPMAKAVEEILGESITGGLVVTRYGHSLTLKRIEVLEAGPPIPDASGVAAAERIIKIAERAGEDDLVIFLLTGGASALVPSPAGGISLTDKQKVTRLLVNSGATIDEINVVRKHLSRIKGGRLAETAFPAKVLTLIVSDVVGSDMSSIGSGPTAPDPTTFKGALKILKRYAIYSRAPRDITAFLRKGAKGAVVETPKPGHRAFERCVNVILTDNATALAAAKKKGASLGLKTLILSSTITGNTREAAGFFASILKEIKGSGNPVSRPACVLMGGETTLKVTGRGKGGRNQEFALACAITLAGATGVSVLAAGTDGTDGPTVAAGAFSMPDTLKKAQALGLDPEKYLVANDSYNFFKPVNGLFITGPTGANVMDVMIGLVR